jgi:uncharacterized protein YndB with AHSA1/START domain
MTCEETKEQSGIELEYDLDEPPQKVWRAISNPEFREAWLPGQDLADPEPTAITPGREVRYALRESVPPFLESTVTFRIIPNETGGTSLRILHVLDSTRFTRMTKAAANSNSPLSMRAA